VGGVVFACPVYRPGLRYTGVDLQHVFRVRAPAVALAAIPVGVIPGCGHRVVVATMYLNGLIPFSAELGNAIKQ
jgi:hypothetical protein